jgi:hypothetical protein
MKFSTQVPIARQQALIDYSSAIFSIGSCFAENMAEKFSHFQFRSSVNPFGILFHPLAIEKFMGFVQEKKVFSEKDIFFHNERWHHFDAHSAISSADKEAVLQNLTTQIDLANTRFHTASHFIITLGTAWVYRHQLSGDLVANCHKMPQREFEKELLSSAQIAQSIRNIVNGINAANPSAQIIFTISPVRHLKDGFVQNQQSKANLVSGLHTALNEARAANTYYFPSYEIVLDELRDYRFYAADMLHPNQVAIDYIWQRFCDACVCETAVLLMSEVDSIRKGLAHRPFNDQSIEYSGFVKALQVRIAKLSEKIPHLNFGT